MSAALTVAEAQQRVDHFIRSFPQGYFSELANLARLTEEAGELAHILLRRCGPLRPKPEDRISAEDLRNEMGDVLFTLICLANQQSIDLGQALLATIDRYNLRDRDRHHSPPQSAGDQSID
ncbi:MAG: nucleotide pyrophosphohydrolase [Leptospirales bacterium]|nr:nucleotide pyrophosphohydrolase [Leptospirales bacterium]